MGRSIRPGRCGRGRQGSVVGLVRRRGWCLSGRWQGQREGAQESRGGRFERGCGQRAAEVRLVKTGDAQATALGVLAQPGQRKLVANGENHEGIGRSMPITDQVGIGHGEIERRVRGLTRLRTWCQIGTGNQIQAVRYRALTVRHARNCSRNHPRCPFPDPAGACPAGGVSSPAAQRDCDWRLRLRLLLLALAAHSSAGLEQQ
jgi:hypothetical protein